MELARALGGAGALGDRPARRAALGVVGQPLAGKEGLLAGREAELLGTVATGQATVLVHPLQPSSARTPDGRGPRDRVGNGSAAGALDRGRARSARARGPELIAVKIRAPSSPIRPISDRDAEPFARRYVRGPCHIIAPCGRPRCPRPRRRRLLRLGAERRPRRPRARPRGAPSAPPSADARRRRRDRARDRRDRRDPSLRRGRRLRHAGVPRHPGADLHALRRRHGHLPQPGKEGRRRSATSSASARSGRRSSTEEQIQATLERAIGEGGLGIGPSRTTRTTWSPTPRRRSSRSTRAGSRRRSRSMRSGSTTRPSPDGLARAAFQKLADRAWRLRPWRDDRDRRLRPGRATAGS